MTSVSISARILEGLTVFGLVVGASAPAPAASIFGGGNSIQAQAPAGVGGPAGPPEPVVPDGMDTDLRDLPQVPSAESSGKKADSASDPLAPTALSMLAMPTSTGFEGMSYSGHVPPHPTGDMGPDYYVQAVNVQIGVFNRAGTSVASTTLNAIWDNAAGGTPCVGDDPDPLYHRGDPAVLYDHLDDRWIVVDKAWANENGPYYVCMIVSKTGDPVSGGWWRYAFNAPSNTDYAPSAPELGLWPSGIFMANDLLDLPAGTPGGSQVWAFNRDDLALGGITSPQTETIGTAYSGLLPANFRGTQPPAGRPNYFVARDPSTSAIDVWRYHVDWTTPANSIFTGPAQVAIASYAAPPALIPQMTGEGEDLQSQGDRLMPQNQYRNLGGVESLWLTHTVGDGGDPNLAGIRWYQLDVTGNSIDAAPAQYGAFFGDPADTNYRWIPSLAVDGIGDMAVGYSVSSDIMYPEIRYAGRLSSDTPGTLAQGETTFFAGEGAQSGAGGAWGTHSSMTIDPIDDCTFWYTNMYYTLANTGTTNWSTQIGSFRFPECVDSALVQVSIGGAFRGQYLIPPDQARRQSYADLDLGPVEVTSLNGGAIIASEGINLKNGAGFESYTEFMGLPSGQLSDRYLFPWYNNANAGGVQSQLRFGNVGTADTIVSVKIAGTVRDTFPLSPNESERVIFTDVDEGPVEVYSSDGVPIIASMRINLFAMPTYYSYTEYMGLSASDTPATAYVFPWYTYGLGTGREGQLRFGNVGTEATDVTVTIGGVEKGTYPLDLNGSLRLSFPDLDTGPVEVTSSGGVPIVASMRTNLRDGSQYESFAEFMGFSTTPTTSYFFPWYNNANAGGIQSQLRFGNVGTEDTIVSVKIAGTVRDTFPLSPNESERVLFADVDEGPVEVYSSGSVPIIASMRMNLKNGTGYESYTEFMGLSIGPPLGLPGDELSSTYLFPWYNNANAGGLTSDLRFGVP
jgi:hypothetical protein